ncbi:xanthine/uracil permease family protein, partial [Striga asiatica]
KRSEVIKIEIPTNVSSIILYKNKPRFLWNSSGANNQQRCESLGGATVGHHPAVVGDEFPALSKETVSPIVNGRYSKRRRPLDPGSSTGEKDTNGTKPDGDAPGEAQRDVEVEEGPRSLYGPWMQVPLGSGSLSGDGR